MSKFQKGQSGNPGGRPKEVGLVRELAQQRTPQAIEILTEIMNDKDAPPAARVSAANAILDRACGRPSQDIALQTDVHVSLAALVEESVRLIKPDSF